MQSYAIVWKTTPLLLLATIVAWSPTSGDAQESSSTNDVRAAGVLESAKRIELRNRTGGDAIIIDIAANGSEVREGDLVVLLDDSHLQDQRIEQSIGLEHANAALIDAEAELSILEKESRAALELANLEIEIAQTDHKRYLGPDGEFALEIASVEREIEIARRGLELAQQRLRHAIDSEGENSAEANSVKLEILELEHTLKTTKARKQLLEGPVRTHRQAQHRLQIRAAELELESVESQFPRRMAKFQSELDALKSEVQLEQDKLEQIQRHIESCRILAPESGIVVYGRNGEPHIDEFNMIEPGATVRDFQTIASIPDMSQLQVRVLVDESDVDRLQLEQRAKVVIDAFPNHEFEGKVSTIGDFPEPSWDSGRTKQYQVIVSLSDSPHGVRLGMTANATIETE